MHRCTELILLLQPSNVFPRARGPWLCCGKLLPLLLVVPLRKDGRQVVSVPTALVTWQRVPGMDFCLPFISLVRCYMHDFQHACEKPGQVTWAASAAAALLSQMLCDAPPEMSAGVSTMRFQSCLPIARARLASE